MKKQFLLQFKQTLKKPEFLIATAVVGVFLVSRLWNILAIPIFNDEAIYIRWAEIFSLHPTHPFMSLTDGKQPLFIWFMGASLRVISDPLLAGRLVSVVTGLIGMIGIYRLTKELFSDKLTALMAALMYLVYPYSLMYDRMALYDSTLAMFAIWALYLEVILVRRNNYKTALITGLVIGGGMLTKSGALFFIYLLPLSLLLFPFKSKQIFQDKNLMKWLKAAALAVIIALAMYSLLRLSPNFKVIAQKNSEFTLSINEWIHHPFSQLPVTLSLIWDFVFHYSTWTFLLLVPTALFIDKRFFRQKLLLLSWCLLPMAAFALFAKLVYPRYILFMMMPLLPLVAFSLVSIFRNIQMKYIGLSIVIILLLPMLILDFKIITDFAHSSAPERDRYAYIEGFYSGVGVKDVVNILESKSQHQKIYVATHGGFGLMPQSLQDYLYKNPNITIESFAGLGNQPPAQVLDAARRYPTYHVFSAPCPTCTSIGVAPEGWKVKEIYRYKRIEDNSYLTLVEIVP